MVKHDNYDKNSLTKKRKMSQTRRNFYCTHFFSQFTLPHFNRILVDGKEHAEIIVFGQQDNFNCILILADCSTCHPFLRQQVLSKENLLSKKCLNFHFSVFLTTQTKTTQADDMTCFENISKLLFCTQFSIHYLQEFLPSPSRK